MSKDVHLDTANATRGGARVPSFDDIATPAPPARTVPNEDGANQNGKRREQSRATREIKTAPPNVPLPKTGLPKFRYSVRKMLGRADQVPELNDNDFERWLDVKIRYLVHTIQITVVVVNSIGGSCKTTHTLGLASFASKNSGLNVAAMPGTRNTTTSATAVKAGISPSKTVTVSQLYQMIQGDKLKDYRDISRLIPRTKEADLFIISEDTALTKSDYGADQFDTNAAFLERVCDALFIDSGNDTIEEEAILYKAVTRADVIVFTANVTNALSLTKLVEEMTNVMNLPDHDKVVRTPGVARSAAEVPIKEKAEHAVVLFGGMRSRESVENLRPFTMRRGGKRDDRTSIGFCGSILGIPWDPSLKTPIVSEQNVEEIDDKIVIRPNRLKQQARIALKQALVAVYERAALNRRTPIAYDYDELLTHYYGS